MRKYSHVIPAQAGIQFVIASEARQSRQKSDRHCERSAAIQWGPLAPRFWTAASLRSSQ